MTRSRALRVLVVCAVLVGSGVAATAVVAAQTDVQITSVSVSSNETITGEPVTLETTVTNLQSSNGSVYITDIYLRTSGDATTRERIEDVGSVPPGGSVTIPLTTTFEKAGEKQLTAHVVVRDRNGNHRSYEYPVYVDVEEPNVKAELSTSRTKQSGTTQVSLTNFGNAELSDVEVAATAGDEEFDRNFLFDVAPGASQTTTFDTENVSTDRVTFTATYTAAGDQHTTQETVTLQNVKQVDGEIRLTSVETTRTGSSVTIEGDAANVGSTDTESVLVSIPNESGVRPVAPSGEYFIGAIEASEFATFELTGEVDAGTSAVPVDITYIVDGERVTTTQDVNLGSGGGAGAGTAGDGQTGGDAQNPASGTGGPDGQAGSGGLPLLPIGVVLVVLTVAGVAVFLWRR
jgi:flagellar basal body-associated protein FliL